jgi:hypothetical protein
MILMNPFFSTIKSLSSPVWAIATGMLKPDAISVKESLSWLIIRVDPPRINTILEMNRTALKCMFSDFMSG